MTGNFEPFVQFVVINELNGDQRRYLDPCRQILQKRGSQILGKPIVNRLERRQPRSGRAMLGKENIAADGRRLLGCVRHKRSPWKRLAAANWAAPWPSGDCPCLPVAAAPRVLGGARSDLT